MEKKKKLVKISVRITEYEYKKLQLLKDKLGLESIALLIRWAIDEMLSKYSKLVHNYTHSN